MRRTKQRNSKQHLILSTLQRGEYISMPVHRATVGDRFSDVDTCYISPITVDKITIGDLVYCRYGVRYGVRVIVETDPILGCKVASPLTGKVFGWTRQLFGIVTRTSLIPDENPIISLVDGSSQ